MENLWTMGFFVEVNVRKAAEVVLLLRAKLRFCIALFVLSSS